MIALELVEDLSQAKDLAPKLAERSAQIRSGVSGDYVFIAFYWLLFMAFSALVTQRFGVGLWLAVIGAVCITAAAQMDFLENLRWYALLEAPGVEQRIVDVREAARYKWWLSLLAIALVAIGLMWSSSGWPLIIGVLYLIPAVIGVAGLLLYGPLVQWAFLGLIPGIIVTAVVFTWFPDWILNQF